MFKGGSVLVESVKTCIKLWWFPVMDQISEQVECSMKLVE